MGFVVGQRAEDILEGRSVATRITSAISRSVLHGVTVIGMNGI